ncbi:hypothetical protein SALB1_3499 [Salinisphaera sp. LB1]|nr:hypothetical protein SALB1_3499 [Salinisphaera sp. LB1]
MIDDDIVNFDVSSTADNLKHRIVLHTPIKVSRFNDAS